MSNSNNNTEKQYDPWLPQNSLYSLYQVFGLSSKNNYSLSYSKENGLIAWISGPYVILYDLSLDKQISFIKNPNNKIISCLKFNEKGNLLITGEGNCHNSEIRLYQIIYNKIEKFVNIKSLFNCKVHKFGIDKIFFIRNDEYIISIGNTEDKCIFITDIKNKKSYQISKYNRPILASDVSDNFIILCGNKFIKYYDYSQYLNKKNIDEIKDKNLIKKSLVELSKLKDSSFVNVVIDKYNTINNNEDYKIYFITFNGYLAEMYSNNLILTRWVHLKASKGITLNLWNNLIGCGCGDGLYRIFTTELKYVCTLKYPPPLGKINAEKEIINKKNNNYIYADIIASIYNLYHNKLVIIYSDKSLISWDINNIDNIKIHLSYVFHSGGIKAMDYFMDKKNDIIKILTCGDDKTVIYWNIPINELLYNDNDINRYSYKHIFYSNYIRYIFYLGDKMNFINLKLKSEEFLKNSYLKKKEENFDDDEYNLTCIKFSPDGNYLILGDSFGNILIYSLVDFNLINKIEAHNGEINSIDMIYYVDANKTYLSSGSSDDFISLIDFTSGLDINPLNDEKTLMEKMSSPVISVIFCIDKYQNLKLIVGEQNSTITFFQIINGLLHTLQKNYDPNLKTYCLNYSPAIKKIISGHNGKISIWKTSTNIAHKHFQVNRGDKLLDNFRIASDNKGLIFATSNDDKFIRIRALHDGKLLAKIQISESISDLFFILNDNYLIASSIEGYLYFFKLDQQFINRLKLDNELKNSTEEKNIITNKLLLLQKLMESDISLSKNNQVKTLLNKFQQSEENSSDLKILDDFVKEGKKNLNIKVKKKVENIELKEEKATDNDDQENENNKNNILNKSNIFEKGLRDRTSTDNFFGNKKTNIGRISLTDTFNSKKNFNFKNNNNKDENKELNNKDNNEIKSDLNNKFSNININEEFANNNIINDSHKDKNNNMSINTNINKEEIKEEIDENKSSTSYYNPNVINNSHNQLSETHMNNLIITQTSYAVKTFNAVTIKKNYDICKGNNLFFEPNKKKENLIINEVNNFEIVNAIEPKSEVIKFIDNNYINDINDENDLKEIEKEVENLLSKIRIKIGKDEKDNVMEKMIDKYSKLIIDKINKKEDNKDIKENKDNEE